jgi:7-carboxy-7-deazaguanine synthase
MQCEGLLAGTPAFFIRLQGCAVGCPWCDTKYSWDIADGKRIEVAAMLSKPVGDDTYALTSVESLVQAALDSGNRHVVITGGEPCEHDLTPLTEALIAKDLTVQIETSGTQPIRAHPLTHVTVSPKINMPGGFAVLKEALTRANEIKHPVGKLRDIEDLQTLEFDSSTPVFLQPLSGNKKATQLCIDEARKRGWRVSIQIHRFIGVR